MQISLLFDCLMSLLVTKCCIFLSPSSPFPCARLLFSFRLSFSRYQQLCCFYFLYCQTQTKYAADTHDDQAVVTLIKCWLCFIRIALCVVMIFGVIVWMTRCRRTWSSEFNIFVIYIWLAIGCHMQTLYNRRRDFRFCTFPHNNNRWKRENTKHTQKFSYTRAPKLFICLKMRRHSLRYFKLCVFSSAFFFIRFNYSDMLANVKCKKKSHQYKLFSVLTNISCLIFLFLFSCMCRRDAIAFQTHKSSVLFSLPREIRSKCLNELTISFRFRLDFSPTPVDFHHHEKSHFFSSN